MTLRAALGRARSRARSGSALADPWPAYLARIEPGVAARPRVHRFARPPIIGDEQLSAAPLAVWIDGDGEPAQRTLASLLAGPVVPTQILSGSLVQALAGARDDRVVLIRAGDQAAPFALRRLGQAVTLAGDAAVITCDDDVVSPSGERHSPRFRPGPAPDRWLACDDSGPLLTVDRERTLELAGALEPGAGWRHELALRLGGAAAQRHAHVPMLLCHRAASDPARTGLGIEAVARTLAEWEPAARPEPAGGVRRIRRPTTAEVSVEVVICFRDRPELLTRCADSVLNRTAYERLSLALVDNGSVQTDTRAAVGRLAADRRTRMLRDERPFNFAALNNAAARSSTADVLVFLNNDTEVIEEDWIATLLEEALRPEIGAVAPILLFGDATVQHAGAALGLHGYAGHPFAGLDPAAETPFGRADEGTRNWLAVTAACLMVQRAKFEAVGGFDETFVVAGNDVDLGLRLTAAGHRSLCVPHTRLHHDESRSRGAHIDPGDFAASERSYGEFRTVGDPFYNPNLTLTATDCQVRTQW